MYISGITIITFLNIEKNMAFFVDNSFDERSVLFKGKSSVLVLDIQRFTKWDSSRLEDNAQCCFDIAFFQTIRHFLNRKLRV